MTTPMMTPMMTAMMTPMMSPMMSSMLIMFLTHSPLKRIRSQSAHRTPNNRTQLPASELMAEEPAGATTNKRGTETSLAVGRRISIYTSSSLPLSIASSLLLLVVVILLVAVIFVRVRGVRSRLVVVRRVRRR